MEGFLFLIGIMVYGGVAYFVISIVNRYLKSEWWAFRYFIQAIIYSLFFGPGAVGGGTDPGFALPAPISVAAWFASTYRQLLNNAVFPFIFWWCVIFAGKIILRIFNHLMKRFSAGTELQQANK